MSKLKELREKSGFRQVEIAEKLSVTQGAVSQWESGICFPKSESLPKLAALYGCSVDELLEPQSKRKSA